MPFWNVRLPSNMQKIKKLSCRGQFPLLLLSFSLSPDQVTRWWQFTIIAPETVVCYPANSGDLTRRGPFVGFLAVRIAVDICM